MKPILSTSEFVTRLREENEIIEIEDEVDPYLELPEIQRQVVARKGPALLFKSVKGTDFSVATNLYGSEKRIDIAFSREPEEFIKSLVDLMHNAMPPKFKHLWEAKSLGFKALKIGTKKISDGPVLEKQIPGGNLQKLPQLHCWPEDGGAFITLPLVYTQSPTTGKSNLGMYRIQLFNEHECGMHIQIHRGGGFHYHEAERQNQSLPVHIYVGGPPALTLSAVAPLPEDVPEILLASLLTGKKVSQILKDEISQLPFLGESDFCIVGEIPPHERKPEGPFGDHYGYYSLKHDYPFVNVKNIFHRKDAIYPATVVGRPPQEDHFIACYLQDLLKPLIGFVMPQVKEVWAYEESGVHSLAGAIVKDRYPREALVTALRILGEGQLSLSKVLMVTDQDCDLKNFKSFFPTILERMDFRSDLHVLNHIPFDTLDYTSGTINKGSKAIFMGIGDKKRELPKEFSGSFSNSVFKNPKVFCPGALAVEGPSFENDKEAKALLAKEECLKDWPFVVLVDDAGAATATSEDFVWHVFTRFDPASDITAKEIAPQNFHFGLTPPLVIDCRLKPWYPKVLESDPKVQKRAEEIVGKYI